MRQGIRLIQEMSSDCVQVLPGPSQKLPHSKGSGLPPLIEHNPRWNQERQISGKGIYPRDTEGSTHTRTIGNGSLNTQQVNKKGPELSVIGRSEGLMIAPSSDPLLRVTQLEQNIRFLQEQHQLMLASLHQEVEQLRQRNRDLQFQLVFTKGGVALVQSSPSSPEDDCRPKILLSPKQFNMTPLQVEILEREITDLKAALHEAKTKNLYLSGIVDEQKKKLQTNENEMKELAAVGQHINPIVRPVPNTHPGLNSEDTESESLASCEDTELALKLEEAEKVIRRLRQENEENRRELVTIKSNLSKSMSGSSRQLGNGNGHRGGSNSGASHHHRSHSQNQPQPQSHRFPPLHTQSYWHHGGQHPHRGGNEYPAHRHNPNGSNVSCPEKENHVVSRAAPTLPNLRTNPSTSGYSYSNTNNGNSHHRRGTYYNANHYYRNSKEEGETANRKYRGGRGGSRGSRDSKE